MSKSKMDKRIEVLSGLVDGARLEQLESSLCLEDVIKCCRDLLKDACDCSVKCGIDNQNDDVGFLSVTTKAIHISRPEYISAISEIASNLEVYPMTNGNLRLEFTIYEEDVI